MTKKSKHLLLLAGLIIIAGACRSQTATLSTNNNIVYVNVSNPLTLNLSGIACKNLVCESNNGIVEKTGCNVVFTPERTGIGRITIFRFAKGKKKKLGESTFAVRQLPNPFAHFAGKDGGTITKKIALVNQGLICYLSGLNCQPTIVVDKYSVIVIKNKDLLLMADNKGGRFESEASELINKLEQGDRLIFSQILVHTPDNIQRSVNPIEFIVE